MYLVVILELCHCVEESENQKLGTQLVHMCHHNHLVSVCSILRRLWDLVGAHSVISALAALTNAEALSSLTSNCWLFNSPLSCLISLDVSLLKQKLRQMALKHLKLWLYVSIHVHDRHSVSSYRPAGILQWWYASTTEIILCGLFWPYWWRFWSW